MTALLEKALEKAQGLPEQEQDAIATQILAAIESGHAWQARFAAKRGILERMADEAIEQDRQGLTLDLDDRIH